MEMQTGKKKTVLNWSSGKDAALAFHILNGSAEYEVASLLTTINNENERIVMHGVREQLLDMQAARMQMPLTKIALPAAPDDSQYRDAMLRNLADLKQAGIHHAAYGDIFLEDLKQYREQQLQQIGISAVFPLWKRNTRDLVSVLEQTGIKAMVVCVNGKCLDKGFLGRTVDSAFIKDLPTNVDACGENGEYHTFVYDAPFFTEPVLLSRGEIVHKQYAAEGNWDTSYYFLDIMPAI